MTMVDAHAHFATSAERVGSPKLDKSYGILTMWCPAGISLTQEQTDYIDRELRSATRLLDEADAVRRVEGLARLVNSFCTAESELC